MRAWLWLTARSMANRRLSVGLTVLSIALAVTLLLGVERLRSDARSGFANTLSGTDLIVGARSGPVQLLLYSVFRIGDATSDIAWSSLEAIEAQPLVKWVVPLSLGDSHRGFRVLGTDGRYFAHYQYGDRRPLAFADGRPFEGVFEAVLGAEVAEALGYRLGQRIVLAHGAGAASLAEHADKPFTVVGILARTGTPVDRTVHVGLAAIEAIHLDWSGGAPIPGLGLSAEETRKFDLSPKRVTAALVGLKTRAGVFRMQRFVNDFKGEPLLAILPGATLQQLWGLMAVAEQALLAISALVVAVGLAGLVAVLVASLGERRRELAILRALGAGPRDVFLLLAGESLLLAFAGCGFGVALLLGLTGALAPWLEGRFGLVLVFQGLQPREWLWLAAVLAAALVASGVPAWRAYRMSLADGMTIRI
ncbi:MAG: ABC transporter permease [Rhodocyclaceae bacterium]|nr:ABC transporter permease [Rhodocyclaceae bacterium]